MRIITHIDFDGLISAHLLKILNPAVTDVLFVQHADVQNLSTENDLVADLPLPKKYHKWYDHHTNINILALVADKTFWNTNAKSAARIILTTHIQQFSARKDFKQIVKLVEAADRIDSGMFTGYKKPTPEEIISMTLLTRNNIRDNMYKHYLLKLLEQGISLEQIIEEQTVKEALTFKKNIIDTEYHRVTKKHVDKYGIKFIILKSDTRITKSVLFKAFDENPEVKYVIAQTPHRTSPTQQVILVQANPYKHNNKVHIGKSLKHPDARKFNEGTAMFALQPEEINTKTEEFIERLATLERTTEDTP